jgi:rubrerythrin
MSPRSKNNLLTAMKYDAFDAAKYGKFAARARLDDDWELARAFQETADIDRTEHFCEESELQGLIGTSPDNLREAIDAETKQMKMCNQFAREAAEDGDLAVAEAFEKISRDKAERCARFEDVLRHGHSQ